MTAQNRTTLKGVFEQGDTPQGSDYADLIDSFLSLVDSTAQSITSNISAPVVVATTEVCAPAGDFTTVSAQRVTTSALTVLAAVSASSVFAENVNASAATFVTVTVDSAVIATARVSGLSVLDVLTLDIATTATAGVGNGQTLPIAQGFIEVSINGSPRRIPFFPAS